MFQFIKSKFFKRSEDKGISFWQRTAASLKHIKPREQVYLIASVVIIVILALIFYRAIAFITGSIVKSFEVDEAAVQSQIVRFNLEDYEKVLPGLVKK